MGTTTTRARVASVALALPALAVALLGGCSGGQEGGGTAAGTPSTSATAGTSAAPTPSTTTQPATPGAATTPPSAPAQPPAETKPPAVAVSSLPPVPVGRKASLKAGVVVVVDRVRTARIEASGPGEIAGPGVTFDVEVRNGSRVPVDLTGFAVTASYGEGTPATPSSAAPSKSLSGPLAPGGTARGTYVFAMPGGQVSSLKVDVASDESPNIAVFRR